MLLFLSVVNPGFKRRKRDGILGEEQELEVQRGVLVMKRVRQTGAHVVLHFPDFLVGPSGKPAIKLGERPLLSVIRKVGMRGR